MKTINSATNLMTICYENICDLNEANASLYVGDDVTSGY